MNRSELLILIALLFGVCHQITDGNPVCPYDSNGSKACDYNTTSCELSPPVVLPTCLARAQSLKIPTVNTVDFRTEVIRHLIPPYVKSYTIVQQNLINFVLTTHLIDRASMEKLIEQLKTAFANLAPKLGDTVAAGNRILGLVNDAMQQSIASITAGEETIQEQQKCINEVNTNLTGIQRMIDNATNEVNRESRLPTEAKRTMNVSQWIYSRFSGYGGADGRKLNATEIALARVQCYQYFAKHLQNQNQTLSEHVAKERAALMTLQNTVTELKQKQTTIANITSELTRILLYVSSLNSTSTSLETVVKELGDLEKLITPLNNIYNEILKHHVIEPSSEGQITYETVEKFKANVNHFTQNFLSINIYVLKNDGNQEDGKSHNKNVTNDNDIAKDKDESNNSNSVDTDGESNRNSHPSSDDSDVNSDDKQSSDDDEASNDDQQASDDNEVNSDDKQSSDDDETSKDDQQSSDDEASNDDQQSNDADEASNDDKQLGDDEDLNSDGTSIEAVTGHSHFKACQSGYYNVATTWCKRKIPTALDIVVIPANFTVIIPAWSRPEFFKIDIYGTLQVHIESTFPPAHSFTIGIFNNGLLTDTGKTDGKNQTTWYFPSNSILFIYSGGRIETGLDVAICDLNSTVCTETFRRTDKSWTILLNHLGQMGAFQGIYLVAVRTGNITTPATWCGGQVPTIDMCNTNDKCNLLILPDVTLTISSIADQPLFDNIKSVDNRGTLAVAVSFRLTASQMSGSVHIVGGTVTMV